MGPGEVFAWIAALLSAIASVLAWAARLLWGREFAAAKDETIRAKEAQLATKDEAIKAKEAQIAALTDRLKEEKELNPMKIREYFVSVKGQLEEYIEQLKGDRTKAQEQLRTLQVEIEGERSKAVGKQDQIKRLESEKLKLLGLAASLQKQVEGLQLKQSESAGLLLNFDSLSRPFISYPDYTSSSILEENTKLPSNFFTINLRNTFDPAKPWPFKVIGEPANAEPTPLEESAKAEPAPEAEVPKPSESDSAGQADDRMRSPKRES